MREYRALEDVQQAPARRWALQQAMLVNMNIDKDTEPYNAEDFLGLGNREHRVQERLESQLVTMRENRKLLQMKKPKKGEPIPDDIPDWARG